MSSDPQRAGLVFAALCALNGAFVAPVASLVTSAAHPLRVAVLVTVFAALAAAVVLGVRGRLLRLFRGSDTLAFALLALLGTVVPTLLFFVGTARTSALDAAMCLQTEPIFSLLLAWQVLGHRLTLRRVAAAAILLAGIVIAIGESLSQDALGLSLLLATPLAWQLSHLLVLRRLSTVPPELLTGARYLWGGLWLVLGAAVHGVLFGGTESWRFGDPVTWAVIVIQGVVIYFGGTMLWYQAISRLDLARATAIVVPSIPLLTAGAAYVLLGDVPSSRQAVGLATMTVGVASFVLAPHAIEERERIPTQTAPIVADAGDEAGGEEA